MKTPQPPLAPRQEKQREKSYDPSCLEFLRGLLLRPEGLLTSELEEEQRRTTGRTNSCLGKELSRVLLLWCVLTLGSSVKAPAESSPYDQQVGIVVASDTGVCLMIANADLHAGGKVQVVVPTKPQSLEQAVVVQKASCATKGNHDPPQVSYTLRLTKGSLPLNVPVIGLVGETTKVTTRQGSVLAQLQPGQPPVSFHSCFSQEGVHLTLWSGTSLTGSRKWHGYYYLDYESEGGDCSARESAPDTASQE